MSQVFSTLIFCGYLGGMSTPSRPGQLGHLLTPDEIGAILKGKRNLPGLSLFAVAHHTTPHQPTNLSSLAIASRVYVTCYEAALGSEKKSLHTIVAPNLHKGKILPSPPDTSTNRRVPIVPVNLKDRDAFHITTEEYLLGLCSLPDELARLATNCVTLKDFEQAVQIQSFLKELFAGFLLLNLKNDPLRKKVDTIKYSVKKTEEIVYDLTVRNLVASPADAGSNETEMTG